MPTTAQTSREHLDAAAQTATTSELVTAMRPLYRDAEFLASQGHHTEAAKLRHARYVFRAELSRRSV